MTLFARSIPPAIPNAMITAVTITAITSHKLFPKTFAVLPNIPPIISMSCPIAATLPVNARNAYLKIQPTTTVYPIASANDPRTGRTPINSPGFRFPVRICVHVPNALIGPPLAARPNAISSITPEEPIKITNKIYGIKNVIPPQSDTIYGNLHIFPIPTAEPIHAKTNPVLLLKPSLS